MKGETIGASPGQAPWRPENSEGDTMGLSILGKRAALSPSLTKAGGLLKVGREGQITEAKSPPSKENPKGFVS